MNGWNKLWPLVGNFSPLTSVIITKMEQIPESSIDISSNGELSFFLDAGKDLHSYSAPNYLPLAGFIYGAGGLLFGEFAPSPPPLEVGWMGGTHVLFPTEISTRPGISFRDISTQPALSPRNTNSNHTIHHHKLPNFLSPLLLTSSIDYPLYGSSVHYTRLFSFIRKRLHTYPRLLYLWSADLVFISFVMLIRAQSNFPTSRTR